MIHCINLKLFNADEPVQHEEKRLATWGTDVPQDLVLDKKLLEESLKKVSIFHLTFVCFLLLRYSPLVQMLKLVFYFVGECKEERGEG